MHYVLRYKNPNDVTRDERVLETESVAQVNAVKRDAKQYPGSCVLVSLEKTAASGKSTITYF